MTVKFFILFLITFLSASDKQLYSTIQMMDQVMVINPDNLQIDQSIST